MLLCAMGYDEEKAGMGNTVNWAVNARALALKGGLVTAAQLKLDWNRETAILNAYTAITLNKNLADSTKTGDVFAVTVNSADNAKNPVSDKQAADDDDFGRPAQKYQAVDAEKPYATYTADPVAVYENQSVKLADLKKAVDKDGTYTYKKNTGGTTPGDSVGGYGSVVEVYKTAEGQYLIIEVETFAGVVDSVTEAAGDSARKIKIGSLYFETEDFKAGDIVLYTAVTSNGSDATKIVSVEAPDTIEGAITAKGTGYVKVDGEKMNLAQHVYDNYKGTVAETKMTVYLDTYGNVVYAKAAPGETTETAKTYAYIVNRVSTKYTEGSKFVAEKPATAQAAIVDLETGEYKVVNESIKKDTTNGNSTYGYYMYTGTGSTASETYVNTVTSGAPLVGTVVEYTVKDDGSYEFNASTNKASDTITVKKDTAAVANVSDAVATSATELKVVEYATIDDKTSVQTYTGIANFPAADTTATVDLSVVEKKDNVITRIFVVKTGTSLTPGASTTVNYAVYIGNEEQDADGYHNDFVVNGEVVSYTFEASQSSLTAGYVYDVTVGADGKATASNTNTTGSYVVSGEVKVVDSTFVQAGTTTVYLAKDYKVVDGTYNSAAGETAADASYAATTYNVGDTITIYKNGESTSTTTANQAAFIVVTSRKAS
jgi:hypothetical protein